MKSSLFIFLILYLLTGCSQEKPDKEDYIELIPVKLEIAPKNKPIMDEISQQKCELEKLETIHKYVIEDTQTPK